MENNIQMIDNYITRYEFKVNRKTTSREAVSVDIDLVYKILKPQESGNYKLIGIELSDELTLKNKNNNDELGKINITIYGIFKFNKVIKEEEIQKNLKTTGVSNLYQILRAYVSSNTALSQSVPTINLPLINFVE